MFRMGVAHSILLHKLKDWRSFPADNNSLVIDRRFATQNNTTLYNNAAPFQYAPGTWDQNDPELFLLSSLQMFTLIKYTV